MPQEHLIDCMVNGLRHKATIDDPSITLKHGAMQCPYGSERPHIAHLLGHPWGMLDQTTHEVEKLGHWRRVDALKADRGASIGFRHTFPLMFAKQCALVAPLPSIS